MNPTKVWARSFRTYESVEWTIPTGLTAILGANLVSEGSDSNGSGKSSLLELLPIALFGPPMPWSEYLTAGGEAETCEVGCELEHAGETYRIRRTYSSRGRGSTKLDFEMIGAPSNHSGDLGAIDGAPEWHPLTRDSQQATDEAIRQTLNLSESVFAHSVYAAQGARHFADPTLPPRERKAILAEALELDSWERKVLLVRADISETKGELDAIEVRLGTFAEEIGQLPLWREAHAGHVENAAAAARTLADAEQVAEEAVAALSARQNAVAAWAGLDAKRQAAEAHEAHLRAQRDKAVEARDAIPPLAAQMTELVTKASQVDELAAALAALEHSAETRAQALREQARLTKGQTTLREQAKSLMDDEAAHTTKARSIYDEVGRLEKEGSGVCEHCKQPIMGESLKESVASMQRDWEALNTRALELRAAIEATVAEGMAVTAELTELVVPEEKPGALAPGLKLAEARQAERDLAAAQERMRQLDEIAASWTVGLAAEHDEAVAAVGAAEVAVKAAVPESSPIDWQATRDEAERQALAARGSDIDARTKLAASEEKIRNLEELADRSQEAVLAKGLLEGRMEHLKQMETAYGKNGIPALLIEAHGVPQIEREASRILEALGVPFRIELVTQREKKSGGLADTLDVVVHGPDGPLRFESYSGGEQTRLAFALRVALARLIASRRASQIGVLFLDELTYLDATGLAAVAEVLKGLTEFRSVVLVSHDERLVDSFDSVITVVRDETGSRLEAA